MKWIRQHWRAILRIVAALMVLCAVSVAYLWFYKIAPIRHTLDPSWYRRHSMEAYWSEVRTGIQRFGWGHLDPFGPYADAAFMAWAMSRTHPDDDISSCAGGHRVGGFRQITNHDLGDSAADWLIWWKENGSKSQEEWIRDGFAAYGVTVTIPPSGADTVPLLTLLGNVNTNETDRLPWFVKYNAFRWLRDSEFNPVGFAISNVTEAIQAEIKIGLLEYMRRERMYPKRDHVGELRFGEMCDPYSRYTLPPMLQPRFKVGVYGLMLGFPCLAVGLVVWTLRNPRHKDVEPSPPAYPEGRADAPSRSAEA